MDHVSCRTRHLLQVRRQMITQIVRMLATAHPSIGLLEPRTEMNAGAEIHHRLSHHRLQIVFAMLHVQAMALTDAVLQGIFPFSMIPRNMLLAQIQHYMALKQSKLWATMCTKDVTAKLPPAVL